MTARVEAELGWPVFVKPVNLGSSVGVSRACNGEELKAAMEEALHYDRKVLVEEAIRGTDCTFSAFVVEAVRVALENLQEQKERAQQENE